VLALAAPVASQGGVADLMRAPTRLELDWFLLALYPLVYAWPPAALWALVAGGTVLLLALPWLPPRRERGGTLQLSLHPGPAHISVRRGETVLEAGLRAGLTLPYDCRAGGCGQCRCTVLHGRVDLGAYQDDALPAPLRAAGEALMCCAVPLEDCEIEVAGVTSLGNVAPRRWHGRVAALESLGPDLMRIMIELPAGERVEFRAGQYINIVLADGARRAFSFANAPHQGGVELHVRRIPGGRFTTEVFTTLKVGDAIDFEGPLGRFTLDEDGTRPILFVAGATGFAPIKSIVEDAFQRGVSRPMQLYWGVRRREELYALELVERWQREHANFKAVPVLSDEPWEGRRGLVHEAMLADHPDLTGYEVYACGSAQMVSHAVPDFIAHGLSEQFCRTDAFVAGPRGAA
jgi:NAD(P)H-flavin reductase/ferredoxin